MKKIKMVGAFRLKLGIKMLKVYGRILVMHLLEKHYVKTVVIVII